MTQVTFQRYKQNYSNNMTKKQQDTLAVLEAQRDSAMERIKDYYHRDQVEWLQGQIDKLNTLIRKIKG